VKKIKRRRCLHCEQLFYRHPRTRAQQKYCAEPPCQAASKKASQQRWLQKPENQAYFRGAHHVNRVQAWRQGQRRGGRLQETIRQQPVESARKISNWTLQETIPREAAETVELKGCWEALALQDSIGIEARGGKTLRRPTPRTQEPPVDDQSKNPDRHPQAVGSLAGQ
jgi:hypothetical protein